MYNNARITRRGSHIQGRRVRSLAGRFRTLKTTTIKQMMTYYFFPLFLQRYVFTISQPRLLFLFSFFYSLSLSLPITLISSNQIVHNMYTLATIYYTLQHSSLSCAGYTSLSCSVIEIVFCTLLHAYVTFPSTRWSISATWHIIW